MLKKSLFFLKKPLSSHHFAPFTTNPSPEAWLKSLFSNKPFPSGLPSQSPVEKPSNPDAETSAPDYWEMAKSLENVSSIDKASFMKNLKEIHQEVHSTMAISFENPTIKKLMESVPSKTLCEMAIENFVGSISKFYCEKNRIFTKKGRK